MDLMIYTLHDEGELNAERSKRVRDCYSKHRINFRCGGCTGRCEVIPGKGKQPDEVGCFTCGARWFGYLIPSVYQEDKQLVALRDRAVRENMSNADVRISLGAID